MSERALGTQGGGASPGKVNLLEGENLPRDAQKDGNTRAEFWKSLTHTSAWAETANSFSNQSFQMNLHLCGEHGSVSDLPGGQGVGAGAAAGMPRALSAAWRMIPAGAEGGWAVRGSVPGLRGERDWSLLVGTQEGGCREVTRGTMRF